MAETPDKPDAMEILNKRIRRAEAELITKRTPSSVYEEEIAVLFTGNQHDAIPRSMILNEDLSPQERITWMVLRTGTTDPTKPGAIAKRSDLARAIGVSAPTVTTHRAMLRVHRWVTHCKHVRNHGKFIGDIYLLHDDPLSLITTLEIDPTYIQFLELQQQSGNKRLRAAASRILMEVAALLSDSRTTELELLENRMNRYKQHDQSKIFSPVEMNESMDDANPDQQTIPFDDSSRGSDQGISIEHDDQSKNFSPADPHQSKKFAPDEKEIFYLSSSYSGSSGSTDIPDRAREKLSPGRLQQINTYRQLRHNAAGVYGRKGTDSIEGLIDTHFPEFGHPLLLSYLTASTTVPGVLIIQRKLVTLAVEERFVLMAQMIGRFAMAVHGWADPIRNLQGYINSLIQAVTDGKFTPDEWAIEVIALVEENKPPRFEDSPERMTHRKLTGYYTEQESYAVKFEKWKQGKEWF